MNDLLPLLVLGIAAGAPLAAALLTPFSRQTYPQLPAHGPACAGALFSLAAAVAAAGLLSGAGTLPERPLTFARWLSLGPSGDGISLGVQADSLSVLFLLAVGLSTYAVLNDRAVQSAGARSMAIAAFLQFATVLLLLAADWLTLFCCWQLSALSALFLARDSAQSGGIDAAAMWRYFTQRTADALMLFGLFLLWSRNASFGFVPPAAADNSALSAAGLCLFAAAAARSGTFLLLPAANAGSDMSRAGSSALLAPAGLYVMARALPLIALSPSARALLVCIGGVSAVIAALTAAAQTDTNRRLAATASSLFGLVVLGLGTGTPIGMAAALALAVAAIPALIGLQLSRPALPGGKWLFLVCALLLCSGFAGQHALLGAAAHFAENADGSIRRGILLFACWCGLASLSCLSFALTRAWMSFSAEVERGGSSSVPADANWHAWLLPAAALTLPLLVYGAPGEFNVLRAVAGETAPELSLLLAVDVGLPLVLAGIVAAWLSASASLASQNRSLREAAAWARDGFGLPSLIDNAIALPVRGLSQLCRLIDDYLIGWLWRSLPGRATASLARLSGPLRTGTVQFYALSVLLAAAALLLVLSGLRG